MLKAKVTSEVSMPASKQKLQIGVSLDDGQWRGILGNLQHATMVTLLLISGFGIVAK